MRHRRLSLTRTLLQASVRTPVTRHYLDRASTSPGRPEAVDPKRATLSNGIGDLGRIHPEEMVARHAAEETREPLAAIVGAWNREVVFTSNATGAMDVDAYRSLRLSVGWCSTQADLEAATAAVSGIMRDLGALRQDPHDRPHDKP